MLWEHAKNNLVKSAPAVSYESAPAPVSYEEIFEVSSINKEFEKRNVAPWKITAPVVEDGGSEGALPCNDLCELSKASRLSAYYKSLEEEELWKRDMEGNLNQSR